MPRRCEVSRARPESASSFEDVLKAPELARAALARLPGGYQVRDWTQENEAYFRAIRIEKTMMGLILMLIVAVAAFNIVATLVMVVSDKRTDIAILRTLGMTPRGMLAVFMTQGVLIGWIGTAIGVIARRRARPQCRCGRAVHRERAPRAHHG